ncbi:MAG: class A beta-lactamase [Chroococcidiopsidaceae cyanobacterium CP_BM_ER_R8_30]|nr:class A beta-lactamase [Chroococcidiopsidaceae cyanobacterium CP_BM_ER_R8_30]
MKTRRQWLSSVLLTACGTILARHTAFAQPVRGSSLQDQLAQIEAESGGRLGLAMLDSVTGMKESYKADERFPMCSTSKVLAVGAVLKRVDQRQEQLDRRIPIEKADILKYAPVTKEHVGASGMTIAELCAAAITLSDNTAANLLIATLGGPSGVTSFARAIGDPITRLDRTEPTLNEALPSDPRDTTSPRAMAHNLQKLVFGTVLPNSSRALLKDWLVNCKTGDKKIRAGLPPDCTVGDKTGSGEHNTANDIAIIWPPDRSPFLLAIYLTGSQLNSADERSSIIAKATRVCWVSLTQ